MAKGLRPFFDTVLHAAGAKLFWRHQRGKTEALFSKSDNPADRVTRGDYDSTRIIEKHLRAEFPDHKRIGEEGKRRWILDPKNGTWIYDPLDGTWNFSQHDPRFAVMMAFAQSNELEAAGIFFPITNQFYFAQRGRGLFLNGNRVPLCDGKERRSKNGGCVGDKNLPQVERLIKRFRFATWNECVAWDADMLIQGQANWLVSFEAMIWDYAPVALILMEGGFVVTNAEGAPWSLTDNTLVAAPVAGHPNILKHVKKVRKLIK